MVTSGLIHWLLDLLNFHVHIRYVIVFRKTRNTSFTHIRQFIFPPFFNNATIYASLPHSFNETNLLLLTKNSRRLIWRISVSMCETSAQFSVRSAYSWRRRSPAWPRLRPTSWRRSCGDEERVCSQRASSRSRPATRADRSLAPTTTRESPFSLSRWINKPMFGNGHLLIFAALERFLVYQIIWEYWNSILLYDIIYLWSIFLSPERSTCSEILSIIYEKTSARRGDVQGLSSFSVCVRLAPLPLPWAAGDGFLADHGKSISQIAHIYLKIEKRSWLAKTYPNIFSSRISCGWNRWRRARWCGPRCARCPTSTWSLPGAATYSSSTSFPSTSSPLLSWVGQFSALKRSLLEIRFNNFTKFSSQLIKRSLKTICWNL